MVLIRVLLDYGSLVVAIVLHKLYAFNESRHANCTSYACGTY